jgi:adenine-specific DNA-methyltransferase
MEKLNLSTPDITSENVQKIAELFPDVITESADSEGNVVRSIDFDALKADLSNNIVDGARERYQFTWPGKRAAKLEAREPFDGTLRPCIDKSVDWDTTQNVYIEGDNLQALKLMRETYAGKVKLIYIDPPYNTGQDFIYDDDFARTREDYDSESGDFDEDGGRLVVNTSSNGRFHSDWCSMMYSRLTLARDLLANDGFIFISIDDSEASQLRRICDEVFGFNNYENTNYIQVRFADKTLTSDMNYHKQIEQVLVYRKSALAKPFLQPVPYDYSKFCFEIEELAPGNETVIGDKHVEIFSADQYRIIKHETGSKDGLKEIWATGSILNGNSSGRFFRDYLNGRKNVDGLGVLYKVYGIGDDKLPYRYFTGPKKADATKGKYFQGVPLEKLQEGSTKTTPIPNYYDMAGDFGNIRLEGGVAFNSGKKPIKLIDHFLDYFQENNFLILDFFSGSASTAHAVMERNARDGGQRKFIMVQIPQICEQGTDASNAGFETICDIGEERIRRAGAKIKAEVEEGNQHLKIGEEPRPVPDVGFRVFRIDSSNFRETYREPGEVDQSSIFEFVDNLKDDRTAEDLLFQVLPKFRIPYSAKVEERQVCGKRVFDVNGGQLVACFDDEVGADAIEAIAKERPLYAVFRDSSLADDATEANFEELFKTYSPDTIRRVI